MSGVRNFGRSLASGLIGAAVSSALIASGLTPAYAAPVDVAETLQAGTLTSAREAAAAVSRTVPFTAPTVNDGQGAKDGAPAGEGQVRPDESSSITAAPIGAEVRFSGHKLASEVKVQVKELKNGASRTATSETGGVVLNSPLEITATDWAGNNISSSPQIRPSWRMRTHRMW